MELEQFACMLFARLNFHFQIKDVLHIDYADIGTIFFELKNNDVYVLKIKTLEQEKAERDIINGCSKILLRVEGGVIHEIIATRKVDIVVVDFDVFDGGDPDPYNSLLLQLPDQIVNEEQFENNTVRAEYEKKYNEYLTWKSNDSEEGAKL